MQWVLLVVVVAALLYLSRFYPKVGFGILAVLIAGAALIVLTTTDVAKTNRSKLPPEDILVENLVIVAAYGDAFKLNARLNNTHSSVELKELVLSVTMQDCQDQDSDNCQVMGQENERINLKIPPGQSRDISRVIAFPSIQPKGTLRWNVIVTETRS